MGTMDTNYNYIYAVSRPMFLI